MAGERREREGDTTCNPGKAILISVLHRHDRLSNALPKWYSAEVGPRITIEPGKRSGQPCIRGLRITVWDVLNWLAAGMTEEQIIEDYPELERDDFRAVYEYAARVGKRVAR